MKNHNNDNAFEMSPRGVPALNRAGDPAAGPLRATDIAGYDPASAVVALTAPPNALALLSALRRRYKLALGVGPILAIIAAVVVWLLVPSSKYTARSMLQVSATPPRVLFNTMESRVDFPTYQKTQQTLIKSKKVLSSALNDPKVLKLAVVREQIDPIIWLEKRLQADYLGEVLRISMSGDKPEDLAVLVNAVTDAYRKEIVEIESKDRYARYDELKKIYNEYQKRLELKRGELKKLTEKVGSKDKQTIRYAQQLALESLSTIRRELFQYQGDLRRAKAELEIHLAQEKGAAAAAVVPEAEIQQLTNEDVEIVRYRARIVQLTNSADNAKRLSRNPYDPAVRASQNEIEACKKALTARVSAIRSQVLDRTRRGGPDVEDKIAKSWRDRIGVLDELTKVTQTIYDGQLAEQDKFNLDTLYIDGIQDDIQLADSAAKRIGEEIEILSVELRAPSRVQQIETADAPRKEDDKRVSLAGVAGFGTFGLFVLGVAFLEFRTRRISSVDEVTQSLGLRVMGGLPLIRNPGRRGLRQVEPSDPYGGNLLTESIDSVRTMILHSTGDQLLRVIMVTSSSSGEGKTSLACHLATSLARAGMRTLLIDCDLRKPTIHRLYDLPPTPGFSEYLRGEARVDEVIRPSTADGPSLITAGVCDASALRALAQAPTGSIFDVFTATHDIVVLDTSPILPVTDTLLVGRHVDAAIYSILRDVSRLPWTLAALSRLRSLDIRILGAVVTGVKSQSYGPYYSSSYTHGVDHG